MNLSAKGLGVKPFCFEEEIEKWDDGFEAENNEKLHPPLQDAIGLSMWFHKNFLDLQNKII